MTEQVKQNEEKPEEMSEARKKLLTYAMLGTFFRQNVEQKKSDSEVTQ